MFKGQHTISTTYVWAVLHFLGQTVPDMIFLILTRAHKVGKADIDLFSKYLSSIFYMAGTCRRALASFIAKKGKEARKE